MLNSHTKSLASYIILSANYNWIEVSRISVAMHDVMVDSIHCTYILSSINLLITKVHNYPMTWVPTMLCEFSLAPKQNILYMKHPTCQIWHQLSAYNLLDSIVVIIITHCCPVFSIAYLQSPFIFCTSTNQSHVPFTTWQC